MKSLGITTTPIVQCVRSFRRDVWLGADRLNSNGFVNVLNQFEDRLWTRYCSHGLVVGYQPYSLS